MFMSVSWDRLMAMSFLTVVEDRSVGLSDTIRPRCPEADRHIRKCQGKRRFIYTNFSLLEVQSSLTIGSSFRASSNIFGFEVGPHVHAFSALRKDGGSSNNGVSPLMDSRGKKSHCMQPDFCEMRSWPTLSDVSCFISYTSYRPIATEAITIKSNGRYPKAVALSSMLSPQKYGKWHVS